MPSPIGEVLAALEACFDSLGVRWYLFGAQAAIYHGVARLTADVDVTILPEPHSTSELVSALEANGFRLRVTGTGRFRRQDPGTAVRPLRDPAARRRRARRSRDRAALPRARGDPPDRGSSSPDRNRRRCRDDEDPGWPAQGPGRRRGHAQSPLRLRTVMDIKLSTAPGRSPFPTVSGAWHVAR